MTKIGLLSDTHGFLDPKIVKFLDDCDEIWHAGDIGSLQVAKTLSLKKKFKAVYGNIDGTDIRTEYPEVLHFRCEDVEVLMKHIGGYPKRYEISVKKILEKSSINLFISGHSHILKVIPDKEYDLLHINPGAAGNSGMHKVKTAVKFQVHEKKISELEIIEIKRGL
ncbi:MAG: metallophosphoesterase family protein [Bacteroidales bacterium]|nr:metallophosphoesterase family protein [Bacteroidales bacterium]